MSHVSLLQEISEGIDATGAHLLYGDRLVRLCGNSEAVTPATRTGLIREVARQNGWKVDVREEAGVALFSSV